MTAPVQTYLPGASTQTVKAITQQLCGHQLSSATIRRMVQRLDGEWEKFARRLEEPHP